MRTLVLAGCLLCGCWAETHKGKYIYRPIDLVRREVCPSNEELLQKIDRRSKGIVSIDQFDRIDLDNAECIYAVRYSDPDCKPSELELYLKDSDPASPASFHCPPGAEIKSALMSVHPLHPACHDFSVVGEGRLEVQASCIYTTTQRGRPPAVPPWFFK